MWRQRLKLTGRTGALLPSCRKQQGSGQGADQPPDNYFNDFDDESKSKSGKSIGGGLNDNDE